MMKPTHSSFFRALTPVIIFFFLAVSAFAQWQPAGDKMKTRWVKDLNPTKPLPEYPRPIMERTDWLNLNGLWNYAIRPAGQSAPSTFDGKILVPFAVESSLSGVMKSVGKENELWYETSFTVPSKWKGKNLLLHFGAVDWRCEIIVNGINIGGHQGGFTPFSFDITPYLVGGSQKLTVKVWDPSNEGYQPAGKQNVKPGGIMYTTVTGIWQTVWIEPVAAKHIEYVYPISDIDKNKLTVETTVAGASAGDYVEARLSDGKTTVASAKSIAGKPIELIVEKPKLWSPDDPFLYDLELTLYSGGKQTDKVKSYAAMRKISMKRDGAGTSDGVVRMQLNNKDIFHFGPLDQGYWPDGLYTAPTDEALLFDIVKTKDLGFNMIRKHQKVEPARWYYHCDRLGMLVWQDMPSGDKQLYPDQRHYKDEEITRTKESEDNFRQEWKEIIDLCRVNPCVQMWIVFNEAWGQFKTVEMSDWTKAYDPTRFTNPASGGNSYLTGDILDVHIYPKPKLCLYDPERPTVLGEYGGIGYPVEGHLWNPDKNWGYVKFNNTRETTDKYVEYAEKLLELVKPYYSGAVYTQTTDVEIEVNGLLTYDRELVKYDEDRIRKINSAISHSLDYNSDQKLSFAFLTDIHQNASNSRDRRNGFLAAIEKVKKTDAKFIVTGGDIVDVSGMGTITKTVADSMYAANKKILEESGLPFYPAIGNHDRFFDEKAGLTAGDELFNNHFGKSYYHFDQNGVRFFVLNSVQYIEGQDLIVGDEQLKWLNTELAATDAATPIVLVLHVPIYSIYYPVVSDKYTNQDIVGNASKIRDAFKGHNLKLVLQGHQHIYEEIYSQGVQYITAGAVSANWWKGDYYGTKYGFLLVHSDANDHFTWEYINIDWKN